MPDRQARAHVSLLKLKLGPQSFQFLPRRITCTGPLSSISWFSNMNRKLAVNYHESHRSSRKPYTRVTLEKTAAAEYWLSRIFSFPCIFANCRAADTKIVRFCYQRGGRRGAQVGTFSELSRHKLSKVPPWVWVARNKSVLRLHCSWKGRSYQLQTAHRRISNIHLTHEGESSFHNDRIFTVFPVWHGKPSSRGLNFLVKTDILWKHIILF